MHTLAQKMVVITGAGSGIGRALALQAAALGARLALSDREEASAAQTLADSNAPGFACACDVRSDDDVQALAARTETEGGADVIVNNAGVSLSSFIGETKREDFEWLMDINFWGVVRGTEAFLPQLRSKHDAHIVNVSSIFGVIAVPSQSAYNASKFAVRGYTECLRQELRKSSVHVSSVHPGGVRTNICVGGRHYKDSRGKATTTEETSEMFAKMAQLSPTQAAHQIWRGVLANAPRILVGDDAKWIDRVQRLVPARYDQLIAFAQPYLEKLAARRPHQSKA